MATGSESAGVPGGRTSARSSKRARTPRKFSRSLRRPRPRSMRSSASPHSATSSSRSATSRLPIATCASYPGGCSRLAGTSHRTRSGRTRSRPWSRSASSSRRRVPRAVRGSGAALQSVVSRLLGPLPRPARRCGGRPGRCVRSVRALPRRACGALVPVRARPYASLPRFGPPAGKAEAASPRGARAGARDLRGAWARVCGRRKPGRSSGGSAAAGRPRS